VLDGVEERVVRAARSQVAADGDRGLLQRGVHAQPESTSSASTIVYA
jgi:hypothetical protein